VPAETAGIPFGQSVLAHGAAQESNLPSLGLPDLTGFEGLRKEMAPGSKGRFSHRSVALKSAESANAGSTRCLRLSPALAAARQAHEDLEADAGKLLLLPD
jgi:hypothetical protein